MNTEQGISVLIAHADVETRDELARILSETPGLHVLDGVGDSETTIALTRTLAPDVLLIDYALPSLWGPSTEQGIETTEAIVSIAPGVAVILLSARMSPTFLRRAIVAGARQFLQLPVNPDELIRTVQQVHEAAARRRPTPSKSTSAPATATAPPPPQGQTIAVFSPRGGVGCTTIATNIAIALKQETGKPVALVDGVLPFGDIGVFLDLPPSRSIADLDGVPQFDAESMKSILLHHRSGIDVLMAPQRPEMAEIVTGEMLRRSLRILREQHAYVVVDTWSALDERVLTALEEADTVILVLSLTLSAIKSSRVFLHVSDLLQFPPEKIVVVATRIGAPGRLTNADLEEALGHTIDLYIPADDIGTLRAINEGDPLLLSARNTPVAQAIVDLARTVAVRNDPSALLGDPIQPEGSRRRFFNRG